MLRWPAPSSWVLGWLRLFHASSLPGSEGLKPSRSCRCHIPGLKSLRLLSNLHAEETRMLASAPWAVNSADWPMKTSVLRQRKGSVRKQHLLSWVWQQGRGQWKSCNQKSRLKGDEEAEDGWWREV